MVRQIFIYMFMTVSLISLHAQEVIRLGIIGLDTSHAPAFIKLINDKNSKMQYRDFQIVAAYPHGSHTIPSSYERIPKYTEDAEKYGVKITSSISELLDQVDCVFLETNDGKLHLEQALEVFKAGKKLFIDKPIGATLPEAIAIFRIAAEYNVPVFTSSTLRFTPRNQELREGKYGTIISADCYSPCVNEPSHAGFFWYGIHGVETLFTIMGTGCTTVSCVHTEGSDVVTGLWEDGRIGTCRGIRDGFHTFGGAVICEDKVVEAGGYEGFEKLLDAILQFFRTGIPPVDEKETLEIYTFMESANESIRQNGKPIKMTDVFRKAQKESVSR